MTAKRCYCGDPLLDDGTCRHLCPPEASPRLLRAQAKKRRENDRAANRKMNITAEEKRRCSEAVAKIDPVYARQRRQLLGAAKRSHEAGARR